MEQQGRGGKVGQRSPSNPPSIHEMATSRGAPWHSSAQHPRPNHKVVPKRFAFFSLSILRRLGPGPQDVDDAPLTAGACQVQKLDELTRHRLSHGDVAVDL